MTTTATAVPRAASRLGYRPDIDGLRAVAVTLVVAFHAGIGIVSGGFVGVDVFFVISGFLITGLLVDELDRSGRLSLTGFYARRVRRLLPLSAVVLVFTAVACAVVLPPLTHQGVAVDVRSAALWVSNWHFAADQTQYMSTTDQSPVLHYWSLSVEEQFYVVWPLLILLVARMSPAWGAAARRRLGFALAALFAASLLASITLTGTAGPWAYFGLHTRAWELAAGAGLALGVRHLDRIPFGLAGAAGWVGAALIVYAALATDRSTPYPGTAALVPVCGAALVLAAGARTKGFGIAGVLGRRGFAYVGRLSYAWYLWHWPLLILAAAMAPKVVGDAETDGAPTTPVPYVVAAVVLSFGLSVVSHHLVENPVRRSRWLAAVRARSLVLGGLLVAVSVLVTYVFLSGPDQNAVPVLSHPSGSSASSVTGTSGTTATTSVRAMTPAQAKDDGPQNTHCYGSFAATVAYGDCRFGDPNGSTVVALVGDSHATEWLPAMDALAKERGWQLWFWAKGSCPFNDVAVWLPQYKGRYTACDTWRGNVEQKLKALPNLELLVVARSQGYRSGLVIGKDGTIAPDDQVPALWAAGTSRTLDRMLPVTKHVVILRDTPWPGTDVPNCLSAHLQDPQSCALSRSAQAHGDHVLADAETSAARGHATVTSVDPTDLVCPQEVCPVVTQDGVILYRDSNHLTKTFVLSLTTALGRLLEPALRG